MKSDEPVTLTMALHHDGPASLAVSLTGDHALVKFLPQRAVDWRALPGRWAVSSRGLKLQVVEVAMPAWLAVDRGLA